MNLRNYDCIILSLSGGKDSQAMLAIMNALAHVQAVHSNLLPIHIDTGNEWPETLPHVELLTHNYGLRLEILKPLRPIPDEIARRGKWPSPTCRYCTSACKRDPYDKFIRTLPNERILHVTGERKEESRNRSTLPEHEIETRLVTHKRSVEHWRPMLDFSEDDIFAITARSSLPLHPAYHYGLTRMACMFCVLARASELRIAAKHHPAIAERFLQLEKSINHKFTNNKSLRTILLCD
jgi:3'-phosphoadenosine 5'-phosphosulfate sulfotransferase (PAPS reductase)/FAD synthetase